MHAVRALAEMGLRGAGGALGECMRALILQHEGSAYLYALVHKENLKVGFMCDSFSG